MAKEKMAGERIDLDVEVWLTEEMLGTKAANPKLYRDWVTGKRPEGELPDEVASLPTVDDEVAVGMTVFCRNVAGLPIIYDYQIKGFFKDACSMMARVNGTASAKLTAYRKVIDGMIFVSPREIPLRLPEGSCIGICERPLRAQTQQGERIALARSEGVPAGTRLSFTVTCLSIDLRDAVEEWLAYGQLRGLGQWRNSGKGRFAFTAKKS